MTRIYAIVIAALSFAQGGLIPCDATTASAQEQPRPKKEQGKIYFFDGTRLSVMQPDGQKPKSFARVLAQEGYFQPLSMRLAPDSNRLAFGLGEFRGNSMFPPSKIYLLKVSDEKGSNLIANLPGVELHNWAWSPDGAKLAFSSWDAQNKTRNWIVDVRSKELEEVKLPKVKTDEQGGYQMSVEDWSPDGRWFVAGGDGLFLVRPDGSASHRLTEAQIMISGGCTRFSPDGRKILLIGSNKDRSETLYVVDVGGGKPKPVVEAKNFTDLKAYWSPDGRRIAYSVGFLDDKGKRLGESNLNVVDSDGQNSVTLVSEKHEPDTIRLILVDWR
jgi:Tol biopolymer transport system component